MIRVRALAVLVTFSLGCSSASSMKAEKPAAPVKAEGAQLLSTVKPDEIECARPGGKLPGDVKEQLVNGAGYFVDPIHAPPPMLGTARPCASAPPGPGKLI